MPIMGFALSHKLAIKEKNMTTYRLSTQDLPTLNRHAIGFDRIFNDLNRAFETGSRSDNYPPYNVVKTGETTYSVELAVAGFQDTELDVELKENILTVIGMRVRDEEPTAPEYIHRGIGQRDFVRKFTLADNMEVRGALVRNGILSVQLEQIIPEEQKARKIAISFEK
jgi:molecular chaperone IbpA